MPYRHAHYYLLLLVALTLVAFWPSYFAVMPKAATAAHIHSATATLWIVLLAFQSWSIHHRRNQVHRIVGMASLGLFPFFFAGSVLVVHAMALKFATAENPFSALYGARLAAIDMVASGAIALLYWSALRWRRKAHLHARYMLATVFFLFAPIFARIFGLHVPPLAMAPPGFATLPLNVELASLGTLLLALALAWKQPRYGRPWLITAGLVGLQMVLFVTLGLADSWEGFVRALGGLPAPALFSAGLAAGVLIAWLGWSSIPPRAAGRVSTA